VTEKSSTYEMIGVLGISMCREATYMTNRRREMGEPWGTPTEKEAHALVAEESEKCR